MPGSRLTDEQVAQAEHLLGEGVPVAKVAEAVGTTPPTIYRRFIHKGDPRPGGNKTTARKPAKKKAAATDEQLANMLTKAAVAPALPMGLYFRCEFCAEHFVKTGPGAAVKLVEMSQDEPALRSVLEWCYRYYAQAAWAGILATWAGVPVAHHLAPEFIYRWIQLPLGLPPRGVPEHSHAPANDNAAPPVTPFAGMDTESILRMAESFGIKIDLPADFPQDATAAETDSEAPTVAEQAVTADPPADEAAAAEADTHTD